MQKDIDKKSNPFSIEVKGGENVERERIFPSMKKGEFVGQSCHWCQYGIVKDALKPNYLTKS